MTNINVREYLSALRLSTVQRTELSQCTTIEDVCRRLSSSDQADPQGKAFENLQQQILLGDVDTSGIDRMLSIDRAGRLIISATPAIRRTQLLPEPWRPNIFHRFWHRTIKRRHVKEEGISRRPLPRSRWQQVGTVRRVLLFTLLLVQTVFAGRFMKDIMPYQGWGMVDLNEVMYQPFLLSMQQVLPYVLQASILVLFSILFCWVSAGFWTALMGFWELLIGRDKYRISGASVGNAPISPASRTAIVMPICNEEVARVFAGLRASYESLVKTGEADSFDVFILSDTNDPDIAVAEQLAWLELVRQTNGYGRIFYRRRRRRVKRKSGNVDDFCRRWGSDYKYMLGLDADSVMTGECMAGMVRLMEINPDAGIIQSSPKAVGMDTLYARVQQFATRVYGPLFTAGLHFWQLGESHYWGHNAIIRMKPFIEHCALAPLPGKGSFAGAILSHDFAEAALMRRAGWGVWIAYDLPGSYEELPPNLLDELKRDRRWCHGNLMNFRLFLVKGMHPVHRAVFLTGVMSYLSAPLWFLFLLLSTALLATNTLFEPAYFLAPRQLYPLWPQWHPEKAIGLFSMTIVLLFLPKLLSLALIWVKGSTEFGGAFKVLVSVLIEVLFSVLLAPVRMIFHTRFVVAAFLGWAATWNSPQRDDDSTPWSEALRRHGPESALGLVWTVLVFSLNPGFLWWLAPIVVSLMLSIPVSVISSRTSLGKQTRGGELFLIPEEHAVPPELAKTYAYTESNRKRAVEHGFLQAVVDPATNLLSRGLATARHRSVPALEYQRDEVVQRALAIGPERLDAACRLYALNDPIVLERLHCAVWSQEERTWVNAWRQSSQPSLARPDSSRTQCPGATVRIGIGTEHRSF